MNKIWLSLIKLSLATMLIVGGSLYYLFDSFISKIATESLSSWLMAEEAPLLEGNLLTTVTKNQRVMHYSEFFSGLMLADFSKLGQIEQIAFGDSIDPDLVKDNLPKDSNIRLLRAGFFQKYAVAKIPNSESKVIIFSFGPKRISQVFFGTCLLLFSVIIFFGYLLARTKKSENDKALEYAEKAARVAHDIRSPLLQLSASIEQVEDSKVKTKLSGVLEGIREITNDLILNRKKGIQKESPRAFKVLSLGESLKELIQARQELYPQMRFDLKLDEIKTPIALGHSELMRSVSNLIENAIEACKEKGVITVSAQEISESLQVVIKDNGKGIPKEVLLSIGAKGMSYGKTHGSGLGIYYAQLELKKVGGDLFIESQEGVGTSVKLEIPFRKTRVLSNKEIQIEKGSLLLVVDDDALIRNTFRGIFEKEGLDQVLDIRYFASSFELLDSGLDLKSAFLLSDYDLQEDSDGLDLVGMLQASDRALLVTGRADDPKVQEKAYCFGNTPILSKDKLSELRILIV